MDNFIKLGQQFLEGQQQHGGNQQQGGNNYGREEYGRTGGHEYNSPDNGGYQSQGYGRPQFNEDEVAEHASREGSGDKSLFSSAMGFINQHQDEHERPVDEQHVQDAHDQAYNQGNASNLSAGSMGSAAALQTLKKFTSGGGGGGGSQSQLISIAMAEASKLFDNAGGASSGNKQDAVNGAAMTVMKLMVQSKFSGTTGGSNSGGLSGLLSMANKFM